QHAFALKRDKSDILAIDFAIRPTSTRSMDDTDRTQRHQHEQKQGHSKTTPNINSNGSTCNNKLNFLLHQFIEFGLYRQLHVLLTLLYHQKKKNRWDSSKSILEIFHHSLHLCSLVHVQKLDAICKGRFTLHFEKTLLFCMSGIRTTYPLTRH
ncbi:hypothetical protein RFI_32698, partial [Reticulomyxa filosa]